jgi:putative endonuclease
MFHVYVLRSIRTGRRYVGSCEDLDERLRRHNLGHSKATRHGVPWTLIHSERFCTRIEASKKERYYKSGRGRDELDSIAMVVRSPRRQVVGSNPAGPKDF